MAEPDSPAKIAAQDKRINELIARQDQLVADLLTTTAELKARLLTAKADVDEQKQLSAEQKVNVAIRVEEPRNGTL